MKAVLAGVAFATLMASPLFVQPQSTEGLPHSGAYRKHEKELRIDYRGLDGAAQKLNRPAPDPVKPWPCSSAPGFWPGYHGGNGG